MSLSKKDKSEMGAANEDLPKTEAEGKEEQKKTNVFVVILKILAILTLLYFFICSLDLLSASFQLLAGPGASELFANSELLANPMCGLMIGILGTVLVQSSSTFTSIIISMVAANILTPHQSVYIVMGANIGTSVTNTIVSLTQAGDPEIFRRSFAAATVHDMFNWCSVIVLTLIEIATGMLEKLARTLAESLTGSSASEIEILTVITDPFTDLIVQLNKDVLKEWAADDCHQCRLLKKYCNGIDGLTNEQIWDADAWDNGTLTKEDKCEFLFNIDSLDKDWYIGLIVGIISLAVLCGALICMVKVLTSLLEGAIAVMVKKVLNPTFDSKILNYFYGYFNILVGGVLTFIVQSSSVFTSTLTPLVGIGLLEIETVYPLFLGANIGTTTTALLASLATSGESLTNTLETSFVHLFFNVFGILLYYPIPFMRIPITLCKILGDITAKYRWFAIAYLIVMFILVPVIAMGVSLISDYLLYALLGVMALVIIFFFALSKTQESKYADKLPQKMQTMDFMPKPLRSLEPYDRAFMKIPLIKKLQEKGQVDEETGGATKENGMDNFAFVDIQSRAKQDAEKGL